jgi:ketosteroid isomerase-like protein
VTPEPSHSEVTAPRLRDPQHWLELITQALARGAYEGFPPLTKFLHPAFVAKAPLSPDALGPDAWLKFFAGLYALAPDLRGEVLGSAAGANNAGMYVEIRLSATLSGRPFTVDVCDYFTFRDGLVTSRVTYFDPLPLVLKVLVRPTLWPAALRLRFG